MARFGLVPSWAKSEQLDWSTMNARSESAAEKPAFKGAYVRRQYCIVPTWTFFEPFYVPGARRSERWGISRADGGALGIAGLWDSWRSFDGDELHSFAMLTINCDQHPLLKRFHKHYDEHGAPNERRTPALLEERDYDAWLSAESALAPTFFKTFDTDELLAKASPVVPAKTERPAQAELLL